MAAYIVPVGTSVFDAAERIRNLPATMSQYDLAQLTYAARAERTLQDFLANCEAALGKLISVDFPEQWQNVIRPGTAGPSAETAILYGAPPAPAPGDGDLLMLLATDTDEGVRAAVVVGALLGREIVFAQDEHGALREPRPVLPGFEDWTHSGRTVIVRVPRLVLPALAPGHLALDQTPEVDGDFQVMMSATARRLRWLLDQPEAGTGVMAAMNGGWKSYLLSMELLLQICQSYQRHHGRAFGAWIRHETAAAALRLPIVHVDWDELANQLADGDQWPTWPLYEDIAWERVGGKKRSLPLADVLRTFLRPPPVTAIDPS